MRFKQVKYFILIIIVALQNAQAQSSTKLWYNQPAKQFEEALVLGNGKTGATVLGDAKVDEIYLNDITLWSGGPVNPDDNPDISYLVPQVREALANEDYKTAEQLNRKLQGKFSESYAPLGSLHIENMDKDSISNYYRELNIAQAIAKVTYTQNKTDFTREYLVSHPDKIIVIKLSANKKNALNFNIKFKSQLKYTTQADGQILQAHGYAPSFAYPSYMGNVPNAIRFDETKGTRFTTNIRVKND